MGVAGADDDGTLGVAGDARFDRERSDLGFGSACGFSRDCHIEPLVLDINSNELPRVSIYLEESA